MSLISSLPAPYTALVVGAQGGLGAAFVERLAQEPGCAVVRAWSRRPEAAGDAKIAPSFVDLDDEASVVAAFAHLKDTPPLRLVIGASGLLHDDQDLQPEKSLKSLDPEALVRVFRANAVGPALLIKHAVARLPREGRAILGVLSARVGSISDNRLGGWHAYRASKAALNQLVRTMSVELARTHPEAVLAALHPGTVDTPLSKPFQRGVPAEKLFEPRDAAARLLGVLDSLDRGASGRLFSYDGSEIAP